MQRISHSGHAIFSVATTDKMLQGDRPDLEEIRLVLREAASHVSDGAKYFELMLKILASDGFSMEEVFSLFKDLFDRKQLADCGRPLMNVDNIPFFWGFIGQDPYPQVWNIGLIVLLMGLVSNMHHLLKETC